MADLRIVDAPVLLQESITDDVEMPTGGLGNFSIRLGDIVWYVVTKEQLANKNYVDLSSKGVKDSLDEHIADKANPHNVTKVQVGLGNVDNTADVDKPLSNATKSAIITATTDMATKAYVNQKDNLKADKATTLSGYGITDAYTKSEIDTDYSGVKTLYDKNIEAGAGAKGWTDLLVTTSSGRTQRDKNAETISVRDYKEATDPDDYLSVVRAATYANSLARQGLLPHITHPGGTLSFPKGVYDFSSITSDVKILCNVEQDGAEIIIPPSYAGTVFTLGKETAGDLLCTANINLPDTNKATGTAIVVGSKFVRLANLNACTIKFGRSDYFDIAYDFSPLGQAVVYCNIYFGQVSYANKIINMIPQSGGWVNANNIHKGNLRIGGDHVAGKYHLYIDGTSSPIIGNNFFGMTLEGGGSEWVVYAKNAYNNNFIGTYIETQSPAKAITAASGVNLTSVNHGYKVNDMLLFHASTLPTGLFYLTPYYVTNATTDTFSVAISRAGTPVSFTDSGVSLFSTRQGQCLFDGNSCMNNKFINTTYPPSVGLDFISTGQSQNNGDDSAELSVKRVYKPNNAPLWRGSNTSFSAQDRPIFAAYPSGKNPVHDPYSWTTALSDKGLLFAHNATPASIYSSFGFPMWQKKGSSAYQLAPIVKADSYTTLPSPSSVAANDRLIVTITVTGATIGDFVSLSLSSLLPAGVVVAWTRVNNINSVQVCFQNITTSAIDLGGQQIKAVCIKSSV